MPKPSRTAGLDESKGLDESNARPDPSAKLLMKRQSLTSRSVPSAYTAPPPVSIIEPEVANPWFKVRLFKITVVPESALII